MDEKNHSIEEQTPDYHLEDFLSRLKRIIIKYVSTIIVGLGLFFLVLWLRGFYDTPNITKADYYRCLADAFTVPGMVLICSSIMLFIYQEGAFTGLLYALRHAGRMLLPFLIKNDISYFEYLEGRGEKSFMSMLLCFFLVGVMFIIGAVICIALFYKYFNMPIVKQLEIALFI